MDILIYEAVSAGLMADDTDALLAEEGQAMVEAVMRDFIELPNVHLQVPSRGQRIQLADQRVERFDIGNDSLLPFTKKPDLALIIAPETGGLLTQLSMACDLAGIRRLGSSIDALQTTTDKGLTYASLKAQAIATPECWPADAKIPPSATGYVIKPIDGCGSDKVYRCQHPADLLSSLPLHHAYLIQAFIAGIDASALCFFYPERVLLLAVNRQKIEWHSDGHAEFRGVETGGLQDYAPMIEPVLTQIREAIPGLLGFIGIDFLITDHGPMIIEINPRLTSAYPGLRDFLGINPAQLWFDEKER